MITEESIQSIWRASRYRKRPFAVVMDKGRLKMIQADQVGDEFVFGYYDRPDIQMLRDDLIGVGRG